MAAIASNVERRVAESSCMVEEEAFPLLLLLVLLLPSEEEDAVNVALLMLTDGPEISGGGGMGPNTALVFDAFAADEDFVFPPPLASPPQPAPCKEEGLTIPAEPGGTPPLPPPPPFICFPNNSPNPSKYTLLPTPVFG